MQLGIITCKRACYPTARDGFIRIRQSLTDPPSTSLLLPLAPSISLFHKILHTDKWVQVLEVGISIAKLMQLREAYKPRAGPSPGTRTRPSLDPVTRCPSSRFASRLGLDGVAAMYMDLTPRFLHVTSSNYPTLQCHGSCRP
jgi:hypothetical protein